MNTSTAFEVSPASAAGLLDVVADPVRWRLLAALTGGTRCVCQLQPVASVSAPALSHHLKVLREVGLVTCARRGRWIDYTLAPDAGQRLRAALPTAVLDADPRSGQGTGRRPAGSNPPLQAIAPGMARRASTVRRRDRIASRGTGGRP